MSKTMQQRNNVKINDVLEGATFLEMGESYTLVEKDGYEVMISAQVNHYGCSCCGDSVTQIATYNRLMDGKDPLGLYE